MTLLLSSCFFGDTPGRELSRAQRPVHFQAVAHERFDFGFVKTTSIRFGRQRQPEMIVSLPGRNDRLYQRITAARPLQSFAGASSLWPCCCSSSLSLPQRMAIRWHCLAAIFRSARARKLRRATLSAGSGNSLRPTPFAVWALAMVQRENRG